MVNIIWVTQDAIFLSMSSTEGPRPTWYYHTDNLDKICREIYEEYKPIRIFVIIGTKWNEMHHIKGKFIRMNSCTNARIQREMELKVVNNTALP